MYNNLFCCNNLLYTVCVLKNAVMSLMMELFEKEANETVGVLGESRLLFKAELTDYNLEQESLRHEARMHGNQSRNRVYMSIQHYHS